MRRATKTGNGNQRGGSAERRALKVWLLAFFGDGITAPCSFCSKQLFYSEITKDRFPKPGRKGGKYVKGNIRPACMSCNASHGAREAALERATTEAKRLARNARRRELYAQKKETHGELGTTSDAGSDRRDGEEPSSPGPAELRVRVHGEHAA